MVNVNQVVGGIDRRSLVVGVTGGFALVAAGGKLGRASAQDKPTVTVGSKDFTEQELVGEILAQLLEAAGYKAERKLNLGGTAIVHQALVSGDVDVYVEYTGTGLLAILNMSLPETSATPMAEMGATPMAGGTAGMDAIYEIVKDEYKKQFNLVWLDPLGFNNTYILAMTQEKATELGVSTTSDLAAHAANLTFGGTQEFLTRPDGLPGLTATYGFEFGDEVGLDPGLVYQAVDSGQVDVISAFATDSRIVQLGLVTLADDRHFFPPYFAAPVVRQELLDQDPAIGDVLNQLAGSIDDATMLGLNAHVDVDQQDVEDVAKSFLQERGLVSG